jgi:hypothetical protein
MILKVVTSVTKVQERTHDSLLKRRLRETHGFATAQDNATASPVEKRPAGDRGPQQGFARSRALRHAV